ncbi:MAG: single-stranded DNA-binding protein [Chloroflexi bacterium]|nr:single-stranded DNA-binding protein [Chloroflexota bacterium]
MASLNKVMIIGNLGADPEMRYTANGSAVTEFRVAASDSWTDQSGERRERTEWFTVITWNRLAETCAQYLAKGRQVYVEGRLQTRSWDGQDGQKHYKTEVIAETVRFLGSRDDRGGGGAYAQPLPVGADAAGDLEADDLPF